MMNIHKILNSKKLIWAALEKDVNAVLSKASYSIKISRI